MNVKITVTGLIDPKNLSKIQDLVTQIIGFYKSYTENWEIKQGLKDE